MHRSRVLAFLLAVASVAPVTRNDAQAQCPALPYQLSNDQIADATQVMANLDALVSCINSRGTVNSGTAGQIAWYATTGAAISGQSLSNLLDAAVGSTQGSILYRSASSWAALTPGTVGYVLQSGGASANPSWAPSGGGGGGITTIVGAGIGSGASTVALPAVPVISRPALASFTWVNQAGATATDNANGPLVLRSTQNTGGNGINGLVKPVAGSDWTVTTQHALGHHYGGPGQDIAGLFVYNSVNGRLFVCGPQNGTTIAVSAYNSTTSFNTLPGTKTVLVTPGSIWTRAQYVSATTTFTCSYSIDGFTWEPIYTTNAPFIGVPTGYGISIGSQGNSTGYVLSLNYMSETSP